MGATRALPMDAIRHHYPDFLGVFDPQPVRFDTPIPGLDLHTAKGRPRLPCDCSIDRLLLKPGSLSSSNVNKYIGDLHKSSFIVLGSSLCCTLEYSI